MFGDIFNKAALLIYPQTSKHPSFYFWKRHYHVHESYQIVFSLSHSQISLSRGQHEL